jgi:arylsulfatase A-like enzyme
MNLSHKVSCIKAALLFITALILFTNCKRQEDRRMNVLFIAVDDLRPELGCYGNEIIKSPNIDRLASKGTVFIRAYCQQAVCSPSRTSLMTGLRPDKTQVHNLQTHFRKTIPDVITLSQHFKNNGYYSRAYGKIYHAHLLDSLSWNEKNWIPGAANYALSENIQLVNEKMKAIEGKIFKNASQRYNATTGPSFEFADVNDTIYNDGKIANRAIQFLTSKRARQSPFFLAVGFYKPHLPFVAPKKYLDLYDRDSIPMASNPYYPENVPDIAKAGYWELRAYHDIPRSGYISEEKARILKHGYYACVSYTDAQIGRILMALEEQGLDDNTLVILWGDHGWKLGEHNMWCKHTNFELDTRAPLICYSPGQKIKGEQCNALIEFIDIYPTLCELADLPYPAHLQGKSFAPLMDNPNMDWKEAAFSQYPRRDEIMGYSMRTNRYRLNCWYDSIGEVIATELYDHLVDPGENINIADDPSIKPLVKELQDKLKIELSIHDSMFE